MGLDIDIYKQNRKGKKQHVEWLGSGYWFVVTYLESISKEVSCDCEIEINKEQVKNLIERCKDVLINYYNNPFDNDQLWIDLAQGILPVYAGAEKIHYDKNYRECVSEAYEIFLKIYNELDNEETVIIEISY